MDHGAIHAEPSISLDIVYEKNKPQDEQKVDSPGSPNSEHVVLSKDAIPKIVNLFELPPAASADLLRALDQTHTRLKKEGGQ
jgi:hypothetical protein